MYYRTRHKAKILKAKGIKFINQHNINITSRIIITFDTSVLKNSTNIKNGSVVRTVFRLSDEINKILYFFIRVVD